MWDGCSDLADKLGGGCLAHEFPGDINCGDGGIDNAAFGDIIEACNGNIVRDLVAAELQGFDGSDGDEVIICEVGSGQRSTAVDDLQHVGKCAFNRWGKLVNDGFCGGHSMFTDCPVETMCPFAEVCDLIGGAEMSRLAAAAVNEIAGSLISSLCIIAENAAAVS